LKFNKLLTSENEIESIDEELLRNRYIHITIEAMSDECIGKIICKSEKVAKPKIDTRRSSLVGS
jgi:hypothetical protein